MTTFSEADLILNADGSVYHLGLKPEHLADTIIVVGDPARVGRISKHFEKVEFQATKREFVTHTGLYKGKRITAMSTGMGVDNIEIAMIELDALANIDLVHRTPFEKKKCLNIIRIGTSGAIREDIEVGSRVASTHGIGLDNLLLWYNIPQSDSEKEICQKLMEELQLPSMPYMATCSEKLMHALGEGCKKGITVTSPGFYAPQGRMLRIPVKNEAFLSRITSFEHRGIRLANFEMETSAMYAFATMLGHHALSINAVLGNRAKSTFSQNPYEIVDSIIKHVLDRI